MKEAMKLYSIYDEVAEEYSYPFCASSDALATRQFKTTILRSQELQLNLKDYNLRYIGLFDMRSGFVEGSTKETIVVDGETLMLEEKAEQ